MTAPVVVLPAHEVDGLTSECVCLATFATVPGTDVIDLDEASVLHVDGCIVGVLDGLAELAVRQADDRELGARFCIECGCTDLFACPGGCTWVAWTPGIGVEGLCSTCAGAAA